MLLCYLVRNHIQFSHPTAIHVSYELLFKTEAEIEIKHVQRTFHDSIERRLTEELKLLLSFSVLLFSDELTTTVIERLCY